MGIVFEAWHEALDRRVAIKILPGATLSHERGRQRFLHEARIIARLRHPHIVPIHSVGEHEGLLFYVMDLIPGTSLDQPEFRDLPTATGSARANWVAGLGIQAAETLAYAHGQGVLHRDVKPSNLLLDQDGQLWLADFGLAKLLDDPSLTPSGEWLGTLRYLAPECLQGEVSVRSDIYGLGLTLYELLVGVPAFGETDRVRLLQQIAAAAFVPPRRLDPTIPPDLETIILKATESDPARRYQAATGLAEDLRRFLDGRPIDARRGGTARRLVPWLRRHPRSRSWRRQRSSWRSQRFSLSGIRFSGRLEPSAAVRRPRPPQPCRHRRSPPSRRNPRPTSVGTDRLGGSVAGTHQPVRVPGLVAAVVSGGRGAACPSRERLESLTTGWFFDPLVPWSAGPRFPSLESQPFQGGST